MSNETWQPIETYKPSFGPVLLYVPGDGATPGFQLVSDYGTDKYRWGRHSAFTPSHWQPLGPPPTLTQLEDQPNAE